MRDRSETASIEAEWIGQICAAVVRYFRFLGDLAHGELGVSLIRPVPVATLIERALPITAQLAGLTALVALIIGFTLGIVGAVARGRWPDRLVEILSVFGLAAPDFWIGLVAISIFAVGLGWLPSGGFVELSAGFGPWLRSLLMPALVLALPITAALTRVVRASLAEELSKDYVRTAKGLGLSSFVVVGRNALRNALIAPITVFGLRFGYILGGAIIVESIFNLPGLGGLLIDSVNQGDIAVVQGTAIVSAVIFVVINLLVDLLYLVANPKLRTADGA